MRITITHDQVRSAFDAVKDDPSLAESRAVVERGGMPAEMIQAMCLRPELLRAFAGFGESVYPGGLLSRREKELVILESSRRNQCQFCVQSHLALIGMIKLFDNSRNPLDILDDPSLMSQRERLAVEYTSAVMNDANRVPDSLFDKLHAQFTEPEIVELTFLIGFINMLNWFNNALHVRYNDEYTSA